MMECRRNAREAVLQALYQCDALDDWSESSIELYFQQFQSAKPEEDVKNQYIDYARTVLLGIIKERENIDSKISFASKHWKLDRMPRVDRNLLRLAIYEICFVPEIPSSVSINEALEIAKRFCGDESLTFINGVLDNIAKSLSETAVSTTL